MPIAYHFTGNALKDGRPIPAIGEKLVHEGPVEICRSGLHASLHPFDALRYTLGPMLHKVECSGPLESHDDKFVCRERTILATIDATYLLRRFAADQALSVAHLWDMPGLVREYLKTLDESKRAAAQDDSEAAARAAAWDAALAAAEDAGHRRRHQAAALDAAWAAWAAAQYAAWYAAWDAAWAAWDASMATARDASMATARRDFAARVDEAFEGGDDGLATA